MKTAAISANFVSYDFIASANPSACEKKKVQLRKKNLLSKFWPKSF